MRARTDIQMFTIFTELILQKFGSKLFLGLKLENLIILLLFVGHAMCIVQVKLKYHGLYSYQ